jgi:hypothetical protein
MNVAKRRAGVSKFWQNSKKNRLYAVGTKSSINSTPPPLTKVYRGVFNQYPCIMTMDDLSTTEVALMPGVYVTRTRECDMETIRKILHELQDNFYETLKLCGARKQIIAPGHIEHIAFCHWASSVYNGKLVSALCQAAWDVLTITINNDSIDFSALHLKMGAAKKLLDIVACVALADGLISRNLPIGDVSIKLTKLNRDRLGVSMTVPLPPSYMDEIKMDAERLNSMYGHLTAEFH